MLTKSCLLLNFKMTACVIFSKQNNKIANSNVVRCGKELKLVQNSALTFKCHVKKISRTIKFSLNSFFHNMFAHL